MDRFFVFFLFFISVQLHAAPAFDISNLSNETDITSAVGIFPDTSNNHELIPKQASDLALDLNRFTPNHSPYINFDKDVPTYWLNIALTNPSRREIVAYIKMQHLDLSKSVTYQGLGNSPSNEDFYQTSGNIFKSPEYSYLRIKVPAETSTHNLIKLSSHSDDAQKLLYLTEQKYLEDINHANWLQGIFIGISITMVLTLLYLYRTSTTPLPLYGALVVTVLCCFQITYTGQLTRTFGLDRAEHLGLFYSFYLISISSYGALTCCLFNRRSFIAKYGHYCFALLVIFLVLSFKANANHATTILLPTLIIISSLCLLGIFAWIEKHPLALNLLITNLAAAFFLATSTLDAYAILPNVFLLGFDDIATLSLLSGFITTSIGKILFLNAQTTNRIYREDKVKQELRNAKNAFLAQFSHEMRTPLNGVLGMTELILDTPLSNNQREYINTIQDSGNKLMTMINDVIDFTRIESGELSLNNKTFELHKVVQESLDDFVHEAEQKQIELICDIDNDLPRYVEGDNERLRQVINGLVNHLINLIEHGEIIVSVSREKTTGEINFQIRDTGIGLHKNGHDSLFDAYQQTKTHIKHFDLSLDLSMIQELVRLMGGELKMASEFGKGNVVWFSLKLETSDYEGEDEYDDSVLQGLHLLTVDDNAAICKVISYHAHSWGMKASSASSGSETLAKLRNKASLNERVDVVILDYKMPVMNGIELAAKIKEDNLITNDVLVIMLTGLNFTPKYRCAKKMQALDTF